METCYIERSTGFGRNGNWAEGLDLAGVGRIVVGIGPGSFAGIRAALAFAQGYALGSGCQVLGLPSPCAIAADCFAERGECKLAVVGDARQGKLWIAEFDGYRLVRPVYQIEADRLAVTIAADSVVHSPDDKRIGSMLTEALGKRYLGERLPTEGGLRRFAEVCPSILVSEPLPIYLNPAVRS